MAKSLAIVFSLIMALVVAGCQATDSELITGSVAPSTGLNGPAIPASDVKFAIEPFTGAPGNTADDISRRIGQLAEQEGISLVRRNGPDVTHRVQGYLAVAGDDSRGILVYVYDIFNRDGDRLFRFTGQETVSASDGDPWNGVDNDAIDNVAQRTVRSLAAWVNRSGSI